MRRCGYLLLVVLAVGSARAEEFNQKMTVGDVSLGKHIFGPALKEENLKHRVVLIEYWGINCAPCLASMPRLVALQSELKQHGLVIVGAHAQGGSEADVRSMAQSRGVNYTITDRGNIKDGNDFRGIPHCFLFDHTGKCIYRGGPGDVEPLLLKAVAAAPPAVLEGRKLTRLATLSTQLKKEANFGSVLQQAQARVKSADSTIADEASYLVEKLDAFAAKQLDEVDSDKAEHPLASWTLVQRVATNYRGTDHAKKAGELLAELRKDKPFQTELKAAQSLGEIRTLEGQLRKTGSGEVAPKDPEFLKLNASVLNQLTAKIKLLKKSAPEARATKDAQKIADTYGLKVG